MKAEIDGYGCLTITPESALESARSCGSGAFGSTKRGSEL